MTHRFLAPGSGVAIPVQGERAQPTRHGHDTDRQPEFVRRPSDLQSLDLTTAEGRFRLGLYIGNEIAFAIHSTSALTRQRAKDRE